MFDNGKAKPETFARHSIPGFHIIGLRLGKLCKPCLARLACYKVFYTQPDNKHVFRATKPAPIPSSNAYDKTDRWHAQKWMALSYVAMAASLNASESVGWAAR